MTIKELENKYPIHDSTITKVVYNKENYSLQINTKFSEGHLEFAKRHVTDFCFNLKGLEMLFKNVERLKSYTDIEKIVEEKNDILGVYVKKRKNDKKALVTIALDHYIQPKAIDDIGDWFFIEFFASDVEVKEIK